MGLSIASIIQRDILIWGKRKYQNTKYINSQDMKYKMQNILQKRKGTVLYEREYPNTIVNVGLMSNNGVKFTMINCIILYCITLTTITILIKIIKLINRW